MLISPSILSVYQNNLDHALSELNKVKTDMLHLDVMDNKFVPNQTFNHTFVKKMREKTNFILDTHLMIEHPELYYKAMSFEKDGYTWNQSESLADLIKPERIRQIKLDVIKKQEGAKRCSSKLVDLFADDEDDAFCANCFI
jgi:pentose-5-phosphate-3-epimerase